jgi:hypothetical protein
MELTVGLRVPVNGLITLFTIIKRRFARNIHAHSPYYASQDNYFQQFIQSWSQTISIQKYTNLVSVQISRLSTAETMVGNYVMSKNKCWMKEFPGQGVSIYTDHMDEVKDNL